MKMTPFSRLPLVLLLVGAFAAVPQAGADDTAAYSALMHGRLAEAADLLHRQLAANPDAARAHLLLCRTAVAADQPDEAIEECLRAVHAAPQEARMQIWLGRAFGLKASETNPIAAYKLASRVRECFEHAVQLEPKNPVAVSDLAEFYIVAPAIAGGNIARAEQLANSILSTAPIEAYRLLGLLAHKNGDDTKAEGDFKQEIAAGNKPEAWADLATFYEHNHDYNRAVAAAHQALALDSRHGPAEIDIANVLIAAKREPELAARALRDYLKSSNQSDDAPVPRVHVLLGKLLAKQGDTAGARAEFNAALTLAPNFPPAQKGLDSL